MARDAISSILLDLCHTSLTTQSIFVPPPIFPGSQETSPATRLSSLPRGSWSYAEPPAPPTMHSFGGPTVPPPQMPPPAANFASESSDSETIVDGAKLNLSFENFESSI